MTSHPIPARGETTPELMQARPLGKLGGEKFDRDHAASLPVEPADAHVEFLRNFANTLRHVAVRRREQHSEMAAECAEIQAPILDAIADRLAALTSEVSRKRDWAARWKDAAKLNGDAYEAVRAEVAQLAEVSALREAVDRATEDAERWRYVSRYLDVMQDLTDDVDFVYGLNTNEICAPAHGHTVESLVDHCRAARRDGAP